MKNVIKLDNYYSPKELEWVVAEFVEYYNNHRYHESLNNLTPSDVFFGRVEEKLKQKALVKKKTMRQRRAYYYQTKQMEKNLK